MMKRQWRNRRCAYLERRLCRDAPVETVEHRLCGSGQRLVRDTGLLVIGTTTPPAGAGTLGDFAVGNNEIGRMEIIARGQVYTSRGFMGGNAGSTNGTAVLSRNRLEVDLQRLGLRRQRGEGTLTVDSGALLSSAGNGYIAFNIINIWGMPS